MKHFSEEKKELTRYGFPEEVLPLLKDLLSPRNYTLHMHARKALVERGESILPVMHRLAESPSGIIRREAALILKQIAHPDSIPVAIRLLEDEVGDIRWIAAEILIAVGRISFRPLLSQLVERKVSHYLREGVHHVLYELIREDDPDELKDFYHSVLKEVNRSIVVVKAAGILKHEVI